MKYFLLFIASATLLIVVLTVIFSSDTTVPNPDDSTTFTDFTDGTQPGPNPSPTPTPTPNPITPRPGGGAAPLDTSFLTRPNVITDPQNQGVYLLHGELGYCPQGMECPIPDSKSFQIEYHESDQAFYVLLLAQPLRQARLEAEAKLFDMLGVTPNKMCRLRFHITAPQWVSEQYAGRELGLSFCQGSVSL